MTFGVRAKDAPEPDFEGSYLRSFRAGDTTVRFCEETQDWIMFWEHFNSDQKAYPCTGDRKTCPGCNSEDERERKASRRYASTVKLVDQKNDAYMPVRIPVSVYKKMVTRSERNDGTILNRDYIIIKEGKGLDTEYDVEADRAYAIPLKDLKANIFDVEIVLQAMFNEIWPELAEPTNGKDAQKAPKVENESQDEEITEADLKKMGIRDLRALARKHGVDSEVCELGTKPELIDAIIQIAE